MKSRSRRIPEEIYSEILLRLPVKSACVCKCVCKTWCSIISNPSFAKSHLNLAIQNNNSTLVLIGTGRLMYSISHDLIPSLLSTDIPFLEYAVEMNYPFKSSSHPTLVGYCDGLLCLYFKGVASDDFEIFFCLWNPATKEYKRLPKSPYSDMEDPFGLTGLGYDRKSDDYKLVAYDETLRLNVYSLRSNSWAIIENVPYEFLGEPAVGVLINRDRLHGLAIAKDAIAKDRSEVVLVSFDIVDQIFEEIQLPNEPWANNKDECMTLGVLEGCLCVHVVVADVHSEVWVMQDYGVQESWTKRYMIEDERLNAKIPIPMWSFKSGDLLFELSTPTRLWFSDLILKKRWSTNDLVIYDPKVDSVIETNIPSLTHLQKQGCYYESLVSLGETEKKKPKKMEMKMEMKMKKKPKKMEMKKKKMKKKKGVITRAWFRSGLVLMWGRLR